MREIRTSRLIVSTNVGWTYLTAMNSVGQGVSLFNVERSSVRSAHDLAASFISSPKEYIFINNSLIIEQDSFNLDLYRRCTKLNLPLSNDCIISAMQAASMTFNVVVKPAKQDLILLHAILELFGRASGLKTNGNKCLLSPIQCNLEETVSLVSSFPGKLDPFPIKYLGIPLSITKLRKVHLQPLVDKIGNCLPTWKSNLLNKAGRAVLIKSKLSAIPIHTAMAVEISPWIIKCIDKRRRSFLWSGSADARGGSCALAWPKVCRPPELGGLGIIDLQIFWVCVANAMDVAREN